MAKDAFSWEQIRNRPVEYTDFKGFLVAGPDGKRPAKEITLRELAKVSTRWQALKDHVLYDHTSRKNQHFYYVESGRLKVEYVLETEPRLKKILIGYNPEQHVFGELEPSHPGPFNYGKVRPEEKYYENAAIVTALEKSILIEIEWENFFMKGLFADENLLRNFITIISEQGLRNMVLSKNREIPLAEQQIKEHVLQLYNHHNFVDGTKTIDWAITASEIVKVLSISRASFYAILRKLEAEKYCQYRNKRFTLLEEGANDKKFQLPPLFAKSDEK